MSYLESASLALVECYENGSLAVVYHSSSTSHQQSSVVPRATVMERKALEFFSCILIWVHVLHCSTQQAMPLAANTYRKLLSTDSPFEAFFHIVGVERWVFITLIDAIEVSIWKREQESKNRLSMRELISKTDTIVSSLGHQIR